MKYIILCLIACTVSLSSFSQESKYKALFIYKFLQNIEWPADKVSDKYTVAVKEDSNVLDEIKNLVASRNINGKSIEVVNYSGSMSGINLLFAPRDTGSNLKSLNEQAIANSVVLVANSQGAAKEGASINFVNDGSRVKFEMNLKTLEASGLKASGSIKSLAVLVN